LSHCINLSGVQHLEFLLINLG